MTATEPPLEVLLRTIPLGGVVTENDVASLARSGSGRRRSARYLSHGASWALKLGSVDLAGQLRREAQSAAMRSPTLAPPPFGPPAGPHIPPPNIVENIRANLQALLDLAGAPDDPREFDWRGHRIGIANTMILALTAARYRLGGGSGADLRPGGDHWTEVIADLYRSGDIAAADDALQQYLANGTPP